MATPKLVPKLTSGHGRTRKLPKLRAGQIRCPVCRSGARVLDHGALPAHRDPFGHDCYNRAVAL